MPVQQAICFEEQVHIYLSAGEPTEGLLSPRLLLWPFVIMAVSQKFHN